MQRLDQSMVTESRTTDALVATKGRVQLQTSGFLRPRSCLYSGSLNNSCQSWWHERGCFVHRLLVSLPWRRSNRNVELIIFGIGCESSLLGAMTWATYEVARVGKALTFQHVFFHLFLSPMTFVVATSFSYKLDLPEHFSCWLEKILFVALAYFFFNRQLDLEILAEHKAHERTDMGRESHNTRTKWDDRSCSGARFTVWLTGIQYVLEE